MGRFGYLNFIFHSCTWFLGPVSTCSLAQLCTLVLVPWNTALWELLHTLELSHQNISDLELIGTLSLKLTNKPLWQHLDIFVLKFAEELTHTFGIEHQNKLLEESQHTSGL